MSRPGPSPGSLFINLLGGFHVAAPREDTPLRLERRKTRALLAVLALHPGRMTPRGALGTLLWAEQSEDSARHALRQCLLDLRHALAPEGLEVIRSDGDLIGLDPAGVVVDVAQFERRAAERAPEALDEAAALYRGDFLEGFSLAEPSLEEWLRVERERLKSTMIAVLRKLLAHRMRDTATDAAIDVAVRLLTFEPFDEDVHRTLMRLYAQNGRRGAAMRQYEECVELLGRELGVEPEQETRALYRRLLSARAEPAGAPASARHDPPPAGARVSFRSPLAGTPLVGRESDLEWLDGLRERAHRGQPQLALTIGEAGIGKSRLVGELASRAQYRRAEILLGRGREGEDVMAFAPWVEALRPALSADLLSRLPPVVRRDLARLLPEIADGPAEMPGGIEDGLRIFEAVARLLRELAARHPMVVVIEDLHWCDDMTLRLFRFLPRRLQGQPVLLVGTARTEEMAKNPERGALLEALRLDPLCSSRTLASLSRDETAQLLRALLSSENDGPAALLADRVWSLSEGNPFVVLECARAIRERGSAGASLELPEQVRTLTARYLAALSDDASRLVDIAAVIGRDFDVAVLRHAAGLSEPQVADAVEELVRRRVLREAEGRFDFSHDRVREVAYERLLEPRRVLLHRQVAEALEAVYAADLDAHCATIGAHYRDAGVWAQACEYQARAGFQAFSRGASREALACLEDARQALARLPDTEPHRERGVRIRLAIYGAHMSIGQFDKGRDRLSEAAALAETLSDRRWAGRAASALCNLYRAEGSDRALHAGERALEIALETEDRQLESSARFVLAQVEHNRGNFGRSLEHLAPLVGESAHDAGLAGHPMRRVEARYWTVFSQIFLGEFDAALRVIEDALRESDPLVDPLRTQWLQAHMSLGKLHNETGDGAAAVRAFEAALAVYQEDYHGAWYVPLTWGLGLAYARAGRTSEGLELLERAEAVMREKSPNTFKPLRLWHLSGALLAAGRIEEARRAAEETIRSARERRREEAEGFALWVLAEVARLRSPADHEEAERRLLASLALAERFERRPRAARCHLRLAWLYARTRRPECRSHRAAAKHLLERMGGHLKLDALDRKVLA